MNNIQLNFRQISRVNNFDFIRFLAAMAVIYSHSFDLIGAKNLEPLRVYTKDYISIGTLAVIVFFIISGFLITQSYDKSRSIKQYLLARCLRIFPALIVVTILTVFVFGPIVSTLTLNEYFRNVYTYSYLLNCFCLKLQYELPGVFENVPIKHLVNGALWSLPYEFLFYVLIIVLALIKSKKIVLGTFFSIIIFIIIYFIGFQYFTNIVHYFFYFLMGIVFYKYRNYITLKWEYALVFLILLAITLGLPMDKHIKHILVGVLLSYIIFTFAFIQSSLNSFSKYGDFSYGSYIFGWIIQQTIINYIPSISQFLSFLIAGFITLCAAYISWHVIESKALKLKSIVANKPFN